MAIKWKPDGECSSNTVFSRVFAFREITKEEYDRLLKKSPSAINDEITESLPRDLVCGYGARGVGLKKTDGRYYAEYTYYDSCD